MTATPPESLPITVIADDDSETVTIEWDENHPLSISLGLDQWTPEQWLDAIELGLEEAVRASQ